MTQTKLNISDIGTKSDTKNTAEDKKETRPKKFNDKYVQVAAWVLLTLGLCIIVSTFYLAIHQRTADELIDNGNENDEYVDRSDNIPNSNGGQNMTVDIVARIMENRIPELEKENQRKCETKQCKMICVQTPDLYTSLYESMELSNCSFLDALVVHNQSFQRGILWNDWHYAERTVQELAFVNSNIRVIRSDAFNTPLFSTTFSLGWENLNLSRVESGALLGLHSLKYLIINTKIKCLDRAFFQPVQTTLVYLKLRAGIRISQNENIFGISKLEKLEYVDLSRNNFKGPITRKTFQGTPNLRYLIISRSKVTAISSDAFTHLKGKLIFLDLTHNMLTRIRSEVLMPLLKASNRIYINFAMNPWVCDCNIGPLARIYNEYRSQFMTALYCKAPHSLYGKVINDISSKGRDCWPPSTLHPEKSKSDESDLTTTWEPHINVTDTGSFADDIRYVHLRCWTMEHSESNSRSDSDSHDESDSKSIELFSSSIISMESKMQDEDQDQSSLAANEKLVMPEIVPNIESLDFLQPEYEMELHLYENNSVRVTIFSYSKVRPFLSVMWFVEDIDESSQERTPCLHYNTPYVITETLNTNKTYTFCYIYDKEISPFNCLPLHVPAEEDNEENIWIHNDHKQFTIGILCLIFLLSTFTGAVVAYFGIKAYPDLLEGSKNVLVVKKSDQTCYVSTISEADYIKKSSLKKKSSRSTLPNKSSISTISQGSTSISDNLTRLSSVKSSSTYFEDAFQPLDGEYEMPKPFEKPQSAYETRCIPNTYVATSPRRSPPPLPKRNSKSFTENIY